MRPAPRLLLALTTCAVVLGATIATTVPPAAAATRSTLAADPGAAAGALGWIAGQLDANSSALPSFLGTPDWGLTEDAILALATGGEGSSASAVAATDAVRDGATSYLTGADFGAPDDRYAGPVAKTLLVAELEGRSTVDFGGFDLGSTLRALMTTTGAQSGRFVDHTDFGDSSNGFSQALGVMGLARTPDGAPAPAVGFLIGQQCPAGGFRLFYDSAPTCASDDQADADTTGLAVQALLTQSADETARVAIAKADAWLTTKQDASGGVGGSGPTVGLNANSTGLSAQTFLATKQAAPAQKATAWIEARQLTAADAGAASADVGAIAYDDGALSDAQANGITDLSADQWRRSTTQAVLALGLPAYSQVGTTPDAPGAALSATTAHVGDSITVTAHGFAYGETVTAAVHSDPVTVGPFLADDAGDLSATFVVPAVAPGAHELVLTGATSAITLDVAVTVDAGTAVTEPGPGSEVTDTAGTLPVTGGPAGPELAVGLLLIALGALVQWSARRRTRPPLTGSRS